jgi:hypothetical protein
LGLKGVTIKLTIEKYYLELPANYASDKLIDFTVALTNWKIESGVKKRK